MQTTDPSEVAEGKPSDATTEGPTEVRIYTVRRGSLFHPEDLSTDVINRTRAAWTVAIDAVRREVKEYEEGKRSSRDVNWPSTATAFEPCWKLYREARHISGRAERGAGKRGSRLSRCHHAYGKFHSTTRLSRNEDTKASSRKKVVSAFRRGCEELETLHDECMTEVEVVMNDIREFKVQGDSARVRVVLKPGKADPTDLPPNDEQRPAPPTA